MGSFVRYLRVDFNEEDGDLKVLVVYTDRDPSGDGRNPITEPLRGS